MSSQKRKSSKKPKNDDVIPSSLSILKKNVASNMPTTWLESLYKEFLSSFVEAYYKDQLKDVFVISLYTSYLPNKVTLELLDEFTKTLKLSGFTLLYDEDRRIKDNILLYSLVNVTLEDLVEKVRLYFKRNIDKLIPSKVQGDFGSWIKIYMSHLYVFSLRKKSSNQLQTFLQRDDTNTLEDVQVSEMIEQLIDLISEGKGQIIMLPDSSRSNPVIFLTLVQRRFISETLRFMQRDFIGQNEVKKRVIAFIKELLYGLEPLSDVAYNYVLFGPPGTGKTEFATIIAKIFAAFGILERPTQKDYEDLNQRLVQHKTNSEDTPQKIEYVDPMIEPVIKSKREDLIGPYVGFTEGIVLKKIGQSLGRFHFIDEVYLLAKEGGFGKTALNLLLAAMTEYGKKFGHIFAGYKEDIERWVFGVNPGFRSRFQNIVDFKSYNANDLAKIFMIRFHRSENKNRGFFQIGENNQDPFVLVKAFFERHLSKFSESNARGVINLVDQAMKIIIMSKTYDQVQIDYDNEKLPWIITQDILEEAITKLDMVDHSRKPLRSGSTRTEDEENEELYAHDDMEVVLDQNTPHEDMKSRARMDRVPMYCRRCESTMIIGKCPICKRVYYCSEKCQKLDWPEHSHECARNEE
jgi:hypothetical protein